MAEITITKENFEAEVMNSDKPVLLDFWATWCAPCKMFAPVLHDVAEEYGDKVKVGKVNVDDQMELASIFQVMSIPTTVLIKDGKAVDAKVGCVPKEQITAMLDEQE